MSCHPDTRFYVLEAENKKLKQNIEYLKQERIKDACLIRRLNNELKDFKNDILDVFDRYGF